jgi:hypothetical protein
VKKILNFVKKLLIWAAFALGVATSIGLVSMQLREEQAPNEVQVHRFDDSLACPYSVQIESGLWQRNGQIFNAYAARKSKIYGEHKDIFLQFIASRRTTRADAPATLFNKAECKITDSGSEVTADGLTISLQKVECQIKPDAAPKTPPGIHQLYGTIHGHWVAIGAGIFANNEEALNRYRPQLIQILKTFKHKCDFEFSPLPTGEAAAQAAAIAEQEAIEKAADAARAAAAAK